MRALVTAVHARLVRTAHRLEWAGPLAVRLALGVVFLTSGWGKLHALDNVGAFFAALGIPAPGASALLVSTVELVAGGLLLLGFGTRIAALLLAAVMGVAIATAKLPGVAGLVELAGTLEVAYLAALLWLVVAGAGAASIDRVLARCLRGCAAACDAPVKPGAAIA